MHWLIFLVSFLSLIPSSLAVHLVDCDGYSLSTAEWSAVDSFTSELRYRLCESPPGSLQYVQELRFVHDMGGQWNYDMKFPVCGGASVSKRLECVRQLKAGQCVEGVIGLQLPLDDMAAGEPETEVHVRDKSGRVDMRLCEMY
jgi:hypothetical protein